MDSKSNFNDRMKLVSIRNDTNPDFLKDLTSCFSKEISKKSLNFSWLYDETGSEIFEEIVKSPEYYVPECEMEILKNNSEEIVKGLNSETMIIELGCGSNAKIKIIIDFFMKIHKKCTYVPIDISKEILVQGSNELLQEYPNLQIITIHSTFEDGLKYISENYKDKSKLLLFLGGTIGNLTTPEQIELLNNVKKNMQINDKFLLGIDLMKDPEVIKAAYSGDVTKRFILNVLRSINNRFNANIDLKNFDLNVNFIPCAPKITGKIELGVRSLKKQRF